MSTPFYQHRRDPQPIGQGWELATAALGAVLLGTALAALGGLGAAALLFGRGWVWPHGTDTITHVLGGILTGQPGRGLSPAQQRLVAGSAASYTCIAVAEVLLMAAGGLAGVLIARYRRPGDARGGMASRGEAHQALGVGELRAAKAIIRPDLYGPGAEHQGARR